MKNNVSLVIDEINVYITNNMKINNQIIISTCFDKSQRIKIALLTGLLSPSK